MIIGISGKKQAGKDLVGSIIKGIIAWKQVPMDTDVVKDVLLYLDGRGTFNNGEPIPNWNIKKFADKLKDIVCILINCSREQLEDEDFKNTQLGEEWWYYKDVEGKGILTSYDSQWVKDRKDWNWDNAEIIKPTPRKLLELIGTECGRDILHPNIWVNSLMKDYKPTNLDIIKAIKAKYGAGLKEAKDKWETGLYELDGPLPQPNWIITDVRFSNEVKAIKDRGGIIIRVNKEPFKWFDVDAYEVETGKKVERVSEHISEKALDNSIPDYTVTNNDTVRELILQVHDILVKEKII